MNRDRPPSAAPRLSVPLADALDGNETLGSLMQRLQASQQRLADLRAALPPTMAGLVAQLRPGPLDDSGWTLLVPSGAAAAKLRQCLPTLQQHLRVQGWADLPIRVKVHVAREV